jgi:uncharacterized protein YdeI (YjbR/CyaY-like superfamily)
MTIKQLYIPDRDHWREWLAKNHSKEEKGIWLIFYKKNTNQPTLEYEQAVEEALCFGWIDSIIKKIDDDKYARKFTPRQNDSIWSELNKKRAGKMIKQSRMTKAGLGKIRAAKKTGLWLKDPRPKVSFDMPEEFAAALAKNKKAKDNFNDLALTYRRHYIAWITTAKRAETKKRRIAESIDLLEQGKKLGLK